MRDWNTDLSVSYREVNLKISTNIIPYEGLKQPKFGGEVVFIPDDFN